MIRQDKQRYEMPATFGPRPLERIVYGDVTVNAISYRTDEAALASLLPPGLTPATDPTVTVSHHRIADVSFLAGREYNIVSVTLAAVFAAGSERIEGNYGAVLWENDAYSLILGREAFGVPKLYAEIPPVEHDGHRRRFQCSEYGTILLTGELQNMKELTKEHVGKMTAAPGRGGVNFRYKHIPKATGGAHVSYLMQGNDFRYDIDRVWVGEGRHDFRTPVWEDAPVSQRVMRGLERLVVKEELPAMATHGSIEIIQGSGHPLLLENPIERLREVGSSSSISASAAGGEI